MGPVFEGTGGTLVSLDTAVQVGLVSVGQEFILLRSVAFRCAREPLLPLPGAVAFEGRRTGCVVREYRGVARVVRAGSKETTRLRVASAAQCTRWGAGVSPASTLLYLGEARFIAEPLSHTNVPWS